MTDRIQFVQPAHWPRPKGYANGVVARGRTLFTGGQIGWDANEKVAEGFVAQFALALDNVLEIVRTAGGVPTDVVSMTIFVTDLEAYRRSGKELAVVWRERFGKHFPAIALLGIVGLVEDGALLEIQAIAALPDRE
jgi:enamine deaminase RidA (YjgF/YER057c/UK114 family)